MAKEDSLQYLKLDFASHREALIQRVRARWPRLWNDFLSNSFGMVLVDLMAWSTSTLAYTINRVAGENYVSTMTLRESAVRLGSNFGYQLRGPAPAVVACEATMPTAQAASVTIAQGTIVRTSDTAALPFEVSKDYTIEAGELTPKETVVAIGPGLSGSKTLSSGIVVTAGSTNVDLTDSSLDLTQYVQTGQRFAQTGSLTEYTISSVESAPGAISNNRMVLTTAWGGATATVEGGVYDRRILLAQGQTVVDRFQAPSVATPNYAVRASQTPVIDGSVSVLVDEEAWTKVSSFGASTSEDRVFRVQTLETDETLIIFGDGSFGSQIPTEALVEVTYRVGGGADGNIALNAINTSITGLIASTNSPVTIALINSTSAGQGGRDAETLEEARVNIPYHVRTNDRAVTLADYQTLSQQYSGVYGSVAYARATVRLENALLEGNVVSVYAWTTGTGGGLVALTPQLKQALVDYLQIKAVGTDFVQVLDGSAVPVPISLRFKALSGYGVVDTQRLLEAKLVSTMNGLRPGATLVYSDLVRSLDETFGVDSLILASPVTDLVPSSPVELFTVPQPDYVYSLERDGTGDPVYSGVDGGYISLYEAQLPVFPIQVWAFRLFLGGNELSILPDLRPNQAMLLGTNLSVNTSQAADKTYSYRSTVNLLTGKASLWLVGAPGDLTMKLIPVQGYASERTVNLFVGYTGDTSQTRRREIRAALKSWSEGLAAGGTIYGQRLSGITSSASNVTDVVLSVAAVDSVTRVALDSPASTVDRLTALEGEVFKLGSVVLNNQID